MYLVNHGRQQLSRFAVTFRNYVKYIQIGLFINKRCKQYYLLIFTAKNKAITIAAAPIRCKLVADDIIMKQIIIQVSYQGVMITLCN